MTTGEKLQKDLGLSSLMPRISRVINVPIKLYYVWYDSANPRKPIHWSRVAKDPTISKLLRGNEPVYMTPLLDIADFNSTSKDVYYILVDLAGDKMAKAIESITLDDLKNSPISDLTKKYRKQRNKTTGTENRVSKLLEVEYSSGNLIFKWLTSPTDEKDFPNRVIQNTNPVNFELNVDPSKTYEIHLEILDFAQWLDTYPEKTVIKTKDIKDILEVSFVKVWSNSPGFHYQGFNFRLSKLDGAIHPTDIPDKQWGKLHGNALLDKHTYGLIKSIDFFLNQMAAMATKYLKTKGLI